MAAIYMTSLLQGLKLILHLFNNINNQVFVTMQPKSIEFGQLL